MWDTGLGIGGFGYRVSGFGFILSEGIEVVKAPVEGFII